MDLLNASCGVDASPPPATSTDTLNLAPNPTASSSSVHITISEPGPRTVEKRRRGSRVRRRLYGATRRAGKSTRRFFGDFKAFLSQGRAVELAIGLVLGAAFTSVVASLVNDIFAPLIGAAIGTQLEDAFIYLKPPDADLCLKNEGNCSSIATPSVARALGAVTWNFGSFLQNVINFILIAFFIFLLIRALLMVNRTSKALQSRIKMSTSGSLNSLRQHAESSDRKEVKPSKQGKTQNKVRECPYCCTWIPSKATRCSQCTSNVDPPTEEMTREIAKSAVIKGRYDVETPSLMSFLISRRLPTMAPTAPRPAPVIHLQSQVRTATKKAGGSSANGRDSQPKMLGIKRQNGSLVKPGVILVRQRGTPFRAGPGVGVGRDHTLFATIRGKVHFRYDIEKQCKIVTVRDDSGNQEPIVGLGSKKEAKQKLRDAVDAEAYLKMDSLGRYTYILELAKKLAREDGERKEEMLKDRLTRPGRGTFDLVDLTLV
ncbi:hypothetical protein HK101_008056 [Irineochytrium annulatum]|nr:hypothetical protein HK101_008056 [Irineochytrium annulatum]